MSELYRYAAFISYSSKDAKFAQRLHRALESYGIPSSLGKFDLIGGGKPNRIYPVFRDREELSAGQLGDQIEANLKASAALIVVCSPNGAASPWVQKEIEFFAAQGRHAKIFAIIPDTAPLVDDSGADCTQSCFPPAFRGDALSGDKLEPLAADARKGKDGFRNAWLKIVAGMVGVTPGQIIDRDKKRRSQQRIAMSIAAVTALVLSGEAVRQIAVSVHGANENRASVFAEEADRRMSRDLNAEAMVIALAGDPAARRENIVQRMVFARQGHIAARTALAAAFTRNRLTHLSVGPEGSVAAFSPDFRRALTREGSRAVLWDLATNRVLHAFELDDSDVLSVALSSDGSRVVVGSASGLLGIWNADNYESVRILDPGDVNAVAVSRDGARVLVGSWDARLWDVASGQVLQVFSGHEEAVYAVALSPDGTRALTGSADNTAIVWDVQTGHVLHKLEGHEGDILSVAFSPDGARVATGSFDRIARLWDPETGSEAGYFEGHAGPINAVAVSRDWLVATGARDRTARLWTPSGSSVIWTLEGHANELSAVAFAADGKSVMSGSSDRTARLWDVSLGDAPQSFTSPAAIFAVAYFPPAADRHARFVSGAHDGFARVFDASTGHVLQTFEAGRNVYAVAVSPDGSRVLTGSVGGPVRLWDVESQSMLHSFDDAQDVLSVAFSPDGTRLVTAGALERKVRIWDASNWRLLDTLDCPDGVLSVAFSSDGGRVLIGSEQALLWDPITNRVESFDGHTDRVTSVAFSLDGTRILTGSVDSNARLFDVESGRMLQTFVGHGGEVTSVAFSSDGSMVLTGSSDITARLWDAASGRAMRIFGPDSFQLLGGRKVFSVAFAPDGAHVLAGAEDNTARIWAIDPIILAPADQQVQMACAALRRIGIARYSDEDLQRFPILRHEARDPCASIR